MVVAQIFSVPTGVPQVFSVPMDVAQVFSVTANAAQAFSVPANIAQVPWCPRTLLRLLGARERCPSFFLRCLYPCRVPSLLLGRLHRRHIGADQLPRRTEGLLAGRLRHHGGPGARLRLLLDGHRGCRVGQHGYRGCRRATARWPPRVRNRWRCGVGVYVAVCGSRNTRSGAHKRRRSLSAYDSDSVCPCSMVNTSLWAARAQSNGDGSLPTFGFEGFGFEPDAVRRAFDYRFPC